MPVVKFYLAATGLNKCFTFIKDKCQTKGHWKRIQWEGAKSHWDYWGASGQYQPSQRWGQKVSRLTNFKCSVKIRLLIVNGLI